MKRLLLTIAVCMTAVLATGCFKPDITEDTVNADKFEGYWINTHCIERDHEYYSDGTSYINDGEYDIVPNDGKGEWAIFRFHGGMVSLIATDDPDLADICGIPVPYTIKGNKLSSIDFFQGDFTDHVTYEFTSKDSWIMHLNDCGTYSEGDLTVRQDYKSWITFKRYQYE